MVAYSIDISSCVLSKHYFVFVPIERMETIKFVVAIASSKNWKIRQMDVKSAFLNGPPEEEVFVKQPLGFEIVKQEMKVSEMRKALYGLK